MSADDSKHTILIVEDDDLNRTLFRDILQHHEYSVLEATSGGEAIAVAKQKRPDLILMDIQLPIMDGYETVARLKADPDTRDIPVMAVTAFTMQDDVDKIIAGGFDDYLSKPIDIPELLDKVKDLVLR